MGKLLEVKNLTKKYCEGATESKVVNAVNLTVNEKEFVMIMGASGSGKTSLLHLIAGIDNFDAGNIYYKNEDLGKMKEKEKEKALFRRSDIGIVFQQKCLIPDLTVYENIMFPMMLNKRKNGKNAEKVRKEVILKLCRQFGLENHVTKYPFQLSGGQQQRTAILRAIINKPPLLLCDEPTGSLNSAHTDIVMKLLHVLNKQGQTIILVTHDIKVAVKGTRVVYIKDGSIIGEFKFPESNQDNLSQSEIERIREDELIKFLKKRGW